MFLNKEHTKKQILKQRKIFMDDSTSLVILGVIILFILALSLVMLMGLWKSFVKAGKPG